MNTRYFSLGGGKFYSALCKSNMTSDSSWKRFRRSIHLFTLLLFFMGIGSVSWGQATLPVNRTAWGTTPTGWTDNGLWRKTNYACSGDNGGSLQGDGKYYKVFFNSAPDKITYSLKGTPSTGDFRVQESVNGTAWTDVQALTSISSGCQTQSNLPLLSTSRYVQFIYILKSGGNIDIDDVSITKLAGPTITVNPTSLTPFTYQYGLGASATAQSYSLSGSGLTSNVTITAPTNFEVSPDGTTYSSSITKTPTSGTLAPTTIYVRLVTGLSIGTYGGGNVTNGATGATTQNVTIPGGNTVTKPIFTSVNNGNWVTGSTWDKGTAPTSADDVVINTTVTSNAYILRDAGTTTTVNAGKSFAVAAEYNNNGTTTINGTFQLNGGGYTTSGSSSFIYGFAGTLVFNSGGDYGVNNDAYWPTTNGPVNVTVIANGGITMNVNRTVTGLFQTASYVNNGGRLTLSGTGRINTGGGFYGSSVIWSGGSSLLYNMGGTYDRGFEWNGTTNPGNVQLANNTVLNYPAGGLAARTITGSLTIDAGSAFYMDYGTPSPGVQQLTVKDISINGNLSLGNQPGGDIGVKGNWTRATAGIFSPNNRAVFFIGSGTQSVTVSGAGLKNETFAFLIAGGSATLLIGASTDIEVTNANGLTLSSTNALSTIDLNGRTITLSGTGNVDLGGGARKITNSAASIGIFKTTNPLTTSFITLTNGSVSFDEKTTVLLNNGMNFGAGSLGTVNGILEIGLNGFVIGGAPIYGSNSTLKYNTGNLNPYLRNAEWSTSTSGPGYPNNVSIVGNSTLYPGANSGVSVPRQVAKNFFIESGSSFYMDGGGYPMTAPITVLGDLDDRGNLSLSTSVGGDLKVGGDVYINNSGTAFNANNRAMYFVGDVVQTLNALSDLTLPYTFIGKPSGTGTTLKLIQNLTTAVNGATVPANVTINFNNANDVLDINGKTLTIGIAGKTNTVTTTNNFKGSTNSNLTLIGNGSVGTLNFAAGPNLETLTLSRENSKTAITLGSNLTINTKIQFDNGVLQIADKNLTFVISATHSGASVNSFINADKSTDPSGFVIKNYNATYNTFIFPIGNGTSVYSPAAVTIASGATYAGGANVAMNVRGVKYPTLPTSSDYVRRYWNVVNTGISNFTSDLTFNYVDGDLTGSAESSIVAAGFSSPYWYLGENVDAINNILTVLGDDNINKTYTGSKVFTPLGSLTSDYFRSITSGSWNSYTSWESSPNGNTFWHNATNNKIPTSTAKGIDIRTGHTITQTADVTAKYLIIEAGGTLTSNHASPNKGGFNLAIAADGIFDIYGTYVIFGQSTTFGARSTNIVYENGVVRADDHVGPDALSDKFASNSPVVFMTGSVFDWNTANAFSASGKTYFPNEINQIPTFKISKNLSTSWGGGAITINGVLEVDAILTFAGSGSKTFRNGISGLGTLTQNGGSFNVGGENAILGGSDLKLILSSPLNLSTSVTVPLDSIVTVSGGNINNSNGTSNVLTVDGTLDVTDIQITNTAGQTVDIYGKYRTSNSGGFSGSGSSIPSSSGTVNVYPGSTVELYKSGIPANLGNQSFNARSDFANLILSGSGTKTPIGPFTPVGTVTIKDDAIFDCTGKNIGDGTMTGPAVTNLIMTDNSQLIVSTLGTQPMMGGDYNLTGGKVIFTNSGSTAQAIRNKTFYNIEVKGTNVGNSSGHILLNPGGSFTVKKDAIFNINANSIKGVDGTPTVIVETGGTFQTGNVYGFHGQGSGGFGDNSVSAINPNISNNITLQPGSTVEYTRPSPLIFADQQITNSTSFAYQNLVLSERGNKIAPSDSLSIKGNFTKSGDAVFVHNGGKIAFNGGSGQSYSSTGAQQVVFNNFTNNNTAGLTINDSMGVYKEMYLKAGSKMTLKDTVTLKSDANNTANIAVITNTDAINYSSKTGGIFGSFIVERYMPVTKKAWHMLARPTKGSTIKESWQEGRAIANGSTKPGFGVNITSNLPNPTALGFDAPSTLPSVKTYNGANNTYPGIPNTTSNVDGLEGYFVFVRGDRSVTTATTGGPTILRTKGRIFEPNALPGTVTVPAGEFKMIGNPYASAIQYTGVTKNSRITNFYYTWDPSLAGEFNTGAFRTLTGSGVIAVPEDPFGPGKPYPKDTIESGQAFFVQALAGGTDGTVGFAEGAKVSGSDNRVFSIAKEAGDEKPAQIRGNIYSSTTGTRVLLDGVLTQFGSSYSNNLDANDATKMDISTESMGIRKAGKIIVIERSAMPLESDTIFYDFNHLRYHDYELQLIPDQMESTGMIPYLKDKYLNTDQKLDEGINTINIKIENIAGSKAADRFYVYFKPTAPTPVTLVSLNAIEKKGDVIVIWKVENEKDMLEYTVEVSADGNHFSAGGVVPSRNVDAGSYQWTDVSVAPGYHYYRLKMTGKDGKISYSSIVKVLIGNGGGQSLIAIYPNPIVNNEVRIQLENQPAGLYKARLLNSAGQFVQSMDFDHAGGSSIELLPVRNKLAAGVYHLEISRNGEKVFAGKMVVK